MEILRHPLERAGEIKQPKRRQTLIDNAEQIRISRRLVQLDCNTPLDVTEPALAFGTPIRRCCWNS